MAGGLLTRDPPILNGLLGLGATMNPNIAAQGRNALASALRDKPKNAFLDPEFYSRDLGPSAANYFSDPENALRALSVAPVPFLSDAAGLAADALMYKNKPESRNMLNFGLTGLGMLPFVPALATAYHGSPYKFDKFDAAHIGKGEGAQAYGHGVYFAESPQVAQSYKDTLAQQKKSYLIDGVPQNLDNAAYPDPQAIRALAEPNLYGNIVQTMKDQGVKSSYVKKLEDRINELRGRVSMEMQGDSGSLYKVDIPDEYIPRMLDWDKPLSQQPEAVRNAMNKVLIEKGIQKSVADYIIANKTGQEALSALSRGHYDARLNVPDGTMAAEASKRLSAAGIPGIRYLDGGSRNQAQRWIAKHPQGGENAFNSEAELTAFIKRNPEFSPVAPNLSSNFVIFPGNEGAVKILERK